MSISESISDVELTHTFEQWRSKTNQLITVIDESSDDNPAGNLISANSIGGLEINTISGNIVTGANVTGTRLLFSGSPEVNFTGATVTDLGTAAKFALVEDSGATITGTTPDSKIERCQINEVEINLNGKNVVLSTAHPCKFPEAIQKAINVNSELPSELNYILNEKENFVVIQNNIEKVKEYILSKLI